VHFLDCHGSALYNWAKTGEVGPEKALAGERWCPKPLMSEGSSPVTEVFECFWVAVCCSVSEGCPIRGGSSKC